MRTLDISSANPLELHQNVGKGEVATAGYEPFAAPRLHYKTGMPLYSDLLPILGCTARLKPAAIRVVPRTEKRVSSVSRHVRDSTVWDGDHPPS